MSELYPTYTRLTLLRQVDDGMVTYHAHWLGKKPSWFQIDFGPAAPPPRFARVTARMKELERAGWVRAGRKEGASYAPTLYELTDVGRAVLAEHGGAR